MHELSITENILAIALRHARANGAARVTDLYLVVGQLSSVIDESVQFYWDMVSADTIAAGAQLHFERIPARLKCQDCQTEYELPERELTGCPSCESLHVRVVAGDEFRLESIAIDAAS